MGYNASDNSISAPLNTWSVAKCIMANSGDSGTLCSARQYINPKSAYKPIRYVPNGEQTDERMQDLGQDEFNKMNYGIKIRSSFNDIEDLVQGIRNSLNPNFDYGDNVAGDKGAWAFYYDCPNGASERTRLTDFVGYRHYAEDWLTISFENHGSMQGGQNTTKMRLRLTSPALPTLPDITRWGASDVFKDGTGNFNGRLCLVLCDNSYNPQYVMPVLSGDNLMMQDELLLTFTPPIAGEFLIYPIFSNLPVSYGDMVAISANTLKDVTANYLAVPYSSFVSWKPVGSGTPEQETTLISVDVRLDNYQLDAQNASDGRYRVKNVQVGVSCNTAGKKVAVSLYAGSEQREQINLISLAGDNAIEIGTAGEWYEVSYSDEGEKDELYFEAVDEPYLWVRYAVENTSVKGVRKLGLFDGANYDLRTKSINFE